METCWSLLKRVTNTFWSTPVCAFDEFIFEFDVISEVGGKNVTMNEEMKTTIPKIMFNCGHSLSKQE